MTIADESTVIKIFAGNYTENNPIILPEQVTLLGDSLREVSIIPQNPDKDLIYVSNGNFGVWSRIELPFNPINLHTITYPISNISR